MAGLRFGSCQLIQIKALFFRNRLSKQEDGRRTMNGERRSIWRNFIRWLMSFGHGRHFIPKYSDAEQKIFASGEYQKSAVAERPDLDPIIVTEGDARSSSKTEPQPPRYTICGAWAVVAADGNDGRQWVRLETLAAKSLDAAGRKKAARESAGGSRR
jgi:hypothetical protein